MVKGSVTARKEGVFIVRDFFINALEKVIGVLVVLVAIGIVFGAGAALTGNAGQTDLPGPLMALLILIGGGLYMIMIFGFLYLGLGIYHNTKKTAEKL